jgi:hypothetical protein
MPVPYTADRLTPRALRVARILGTPISEKMSVPKILRPSSFATRTVYESKATPAPEFNPKPVPSAIEQI